MKIVGYHKHSRRLEKTVRRFLKGARIYGHITKMYELTREMRDSKIKRIPRADLYVLCGWYAVRDALIIPGLVKSNILIIADSCIRPLNFKITKYRDKYAKGVYMSISNMLSCVGSKYIDLPSDRWENIKNAKNISISPWRSGGGVVLVTYASDGIYLNNDRTVQSFLDCIKMCRKRNLEVVICSHPNEVTRDVPFGNASKIDEFKGLGCKFDVGADKYLDRAMCVVGYPGTTLFKATVLGIPAFPVLPCYISNLYEDYDMTDINAFLDKLPTPNRDKWFNWLSYQQWTYNEIGKGLPWKFLIEDKNMNFNKELL